MFLVCKTVYFRKTIKFAQYIGRRSVNCNKIRESMISCVGFFFLEMGGDLRGGGSRAWHDPFCKPHPFYGCSLHGQLGWAGAEWAWLTLRARPHRAGPVHSGRGMTSPICLMIPKHHFPNLPKNLHQLLLCFSFLQI